MHGLSPDKRGLLFTPHTGFLDSEPSLSAVWCGRHEEPGWPCCHRLCADRTQAKRAGPKLEAGP
uniref:Uncharacterized protein n=1 Tax=Klebsiella pneumoniae TaxID=573 RepID=A0A0U3AUV2_KLEPN|nr:hypothetical protein [Klebsiella pneumoniae]